MIRVLIFFIVLAVLAYGGMLLVQNPGHVSMDWHGYVVNAPAALALGVLIVAVIVIWTILRLIFGLPSMLSFATRQRRREKGYSALTRGLVAVGSGDARTAGRESSQASRQLRDDPLAMMLRAQAAHLSGDGHGAQSAFEELAEREDTRVLGLRGLYAEAKRRGDDEAARHFAAAAHRATPLPWSAHAVLEHRAAEQDWEKALATVESSVSANLIDKETGERQRAVLETAIAQDKEFTAPDEALSLARAAIKRAPDLAPPVVVAASLLTRRGDIKKASRLIEKAWPRCQHPDIAQAYLDVRPGDSTGDRLARAKMLMGLAAFDPVARMTMARAAMASKDFDAARSAMEPLIGEGKRPTIKMCMLMAELEDQEHGNAGQAREWQARAAHAALDPAWVADGTVYDHWAPASPTTGRLDAFNWQVPAARMGQVMDAMPARRPDATLSSASSPTLTHRDEPDMLSPPKDANADDIEVIPPSRDETPRPVATETVARGAASTRDSAATREATVHDAVPEGESKPFFRKPSEFVQPESEEPEEPKNTKPLHRASDRPFYRIPLAEAPNENGAAAPSETASGNYSPYLDAPATPHQHDASGEPPESNEVPTDTSPDPAASRPRADWRSSGITSG